MKLKNIVEFMTASICMLVSYFFGQSTDILISLVFMMLVDLVSGFLVSAVFKNSKKTASGALSSREMLKGLSRKIGIIMLVAVAHRIDVLYNQNIFMSGCIIAFIIEELLSVIENFGLMGIPIPKLIKQAVDILNEKMDNDIINKI